MRRVEPEPGGRFISDRDEAERRRVCVIGSLVKEEAFGDQPAVGRTILMNNIPFTVIGTIAKKQQDSNYNGPDDKHVFVPSATAVASLGLRDPDNLVIELVERAKGKDVIPEVRRVLAGRHRFDPTDEEAISVWDVGEGLVLFQTIFLGFRTFLAILGSFTLAVAAIGVANTMSMVVEDRTPHIGISMALGARRRWVLGQVLLETVCFTVAGGVMGVAAASLVVWAASFLPWKQYVGVPQISASTAILTAAMLGICGILSGIGPARRASAMSPAEALRT
jgi:putative ABC transport system permease protein